MPSDVLDIATAIGTVLTAVFTAFAAFSSLRSVNQMKKDREEEKLRQATLVTAWIELSSNDRYHRIILNNASYGPITNLSLVVHNESKEKPDCDVPNPGVSWPILPPGKWFCRENSPNHDFPYLYPCRFETADNSTWNPDNNPVRLCWISSLEFTDMYGIKRIFRNEHGAGLAPVKNLVKKRSLRRLLERIGIRS